VPVPRGGEARDAAEARQLAATLLPPLVCKLSVAGLVHKSEVGGVVLALPDAEAVFRAAAELLEQSEPGARLLVEEQAARALELIVGIKRDPVFGPMVLVGMGGIYAEILRDSVLRRCPVDAAEADAMLRELRAAPLLEGARGRPAVDRASLQGLIVRLSEWAATRPDVVEVDLNPVLASEAGAIAVDATVVIANVASASPVAAAARPGSEGRSFATASVAHGPWPPPLGPFFSPKSVAVVGASANPRKAGNVIVRNLQRFGYEGRILPVNPDGGTILGLEVHSTLASLAPPAELAMVVVPKAGLANVIADAASAGTRHLIVATGGFADAGPDGEAEQRHLLELARSAGIRIMGPNSIGVIDAHQRLTTSITTLEPLTPGRVALVGQSGTFASGYANWLASRRRPGVSKVACIGNKGHVDEADLLDFLADDPETQIIGLYTEGIANRAFPAALGRLAGRKPLVVLRSGQSELGRAAIASHTGSLAGDAAVFDEVLREAGAISVRDIDELFFTLEALDVLPVPRGPGVGVVSVTGIGCVLAADAAAQSGVRLPALGAGALARVRQWIPDWAPARNPFDIWSAIERHGAEAAYRGVAEAVIEDEHIHALLLLFVLIEQSHFDVGRLCRELGERAPDKPIVAAILGGSESAMADWTAALEAAGAVVAATPARALGVLGRLAGWSAVRARARREAKLRA
jgi:acyl-CoA synthetase (NDP forming)